MSFGHPYFLLAFLLLPVVGLLYLRRAGKREAVVPSLMLWRTAASEAIAETGKRPGWFDLPLVLALVFFAAVIVAASEPTIDARCEAAPDVLIIVDRSASMATKTESGKTRLDRSIQDVVGLLERLDCGEVMLIGLPLAAGPALEKLAPAEARRRLRELAPTDMPLDLMHGLSRCVGSGRRVSAVIVITDDVEAVPERLGGKPVLVVSHGGPSSNIAIDAFEVSRSDAGVLVFAAVKNYSQVSAEVPVAVLADGEKAEQFNLKVRAGGRAMFCAGPLKEAAEIKVRLKPNDDLQSDNTAVAVHSQEERLHVAYVGRENQIIMRALGLLPGVEVSRFRLTGDVKGGFDLYIYDGVTPDRLPAGDVILIDPLGKVGPFTVQDPVTNTAGMRAVATDKSPLLQNVDVGALRFERALNVVAEPPARELVTIANAQATVVMRCETESTRVTLIGCGLRLSETNWPMLPSFPIFWANLVAAAAGREDLIAALPVYSLTGRRVVVSRPVGGRLTVAGPGGERVPLIPGYGARSYFLPTKAGIYKTDGWRRAVNMLHPAESDNSGSASSPAPGLQKLVLAPVERAGVSLWGIFAITALACALAYWAVAAREGH